MFYNLRRFKSNLKFYRDKLLKRDFIEYHYFPFNSDKPMPKDGDKVMAKFCTLLEELNVKYRITDGTVLGLYREGKFISHDNDIDIDVLGIDKWKIIDRTFKKEGMTLGRKAIYKGKIQQLVYYTKSEIIFDILFWYEKRGKVFNYSERNFERSQNIKFFDNLGKIEFKNKNYPVPAPIEPWLELRYGLDWKIPKTFKGDWKEECFDLKKMEE